jgi:hypothetical protein
MSPVPRGQLNLSHRSQSKRSLPYKRGKAKVSRPFGTVSVFCDPTPHFVRGYFQPSRQMPGLVTDASPRIRLSNKIKATNSTDPLIWTALIVNER